ncbi:unnamed protein product [Phytomonas sp. EM1]|nr:unnamed protein product [Phytomonas sp. EM1]|eukprot:CCW61015.1 unnamed protein product [Phytomonas sp. isolate EM1]
MANEDIDENEEPFAKPTRAKRTRSAAPPAPPTKHPQASADDPMAVFFEAAFPSPSKFDDMLMQSGGLPEARRNHGRGRSRQPNLILPASIIRHR